MEQVYTTRILQIKHVRRHKDEPECSEEDYATPGHDCHRRLQEADTHYMPYGGYGGGRHKDLHAASDKDKGHKWGRKMETRWNITLPLDGRDLSYNPLSTYPGGYHIGGGGGISAGLLDGNGVTYGTALPPSVHAAQVQGTINKLTPPEKRRRRNRSGGDGDGDADDNSSSGRRRRL